MGASFANEACVDLVTTPLGSSNPWDTGLG